MHCEEGKEKGPAEGCRYLQKESEKTLEGQIHERENLLQREKEAMEMRIEGRGGPEERAFSLWKVLGFSLYNFLNLLLIHVRVFAMPGIHHRNDDARLDLKLGL